MLSDFINIYINVPNRTSISKADYDFLARFQPMKREQYWENIKFNDSDENNTISKNYSLIYEDKQGDAYELLLTSDDEADWQERKKELGFFSGLELEPDLKPEENLKLPFSLDLADEWGRMCFYR